MVNVTDWLAVQGLADVDFNKPSGVQIDAMRQRLPALRAMLKDAQAKLAAAQPGVDAARAVRDEALRETSMSISPQPQGAAAMLTDDIDDGTAWNRMAAYTGLAAKESKFKDAAARVEQAEAHVTAAQSELDEVSDEIARLTTSDDPVLDLAESLLRRAHDFLEIDLRLTTAAARKNSGPMMPWNLPLARTIWEARNQLQHWKSAPTYDKHGQLESRELHHVFLALTRYQPASFGLNQPPASVQQVEPIIRAKSWAREVVLLMGWTTAAKVQQDVNSIHP